MQTVHEIIPLQKALQRLRQQGARLALVPTMGALHAGHMALIERAKAEADIIIGSIFVNPRQFGPKEDFTNYPRALAADQAKVEAAGMHLLWAPTPTAMYPHGYVTNVTVPGLSDVLCGAARPGHFDGVATIVTKLFTLIRPDVAVFGEKDWQQLAIIRRLTEDLNLGVKIIGEAIVREADGLAMSSRNAYLSAIERQQVLSLPHALETARREILEGQSLAVVLAKARHTILAGGFSEIDYVTLCDPNTLDTQRAFKGEAQLLAAARIGKTRLIDNLAVRA